MLKKFFLEPYNTGNRTWTRALILAAYELSPSITFYDELSPGLF
jgi:hypothetical protein